MIIMKKILLTVMAAVMLFGADLSLAKAQQNPASKTPVINHRQHRQRKRIRQGVHSGELTKGEAHTLRNEQRGVRAEKKAAKADSVVTREERHKIRADQRKAS